MSEPIQVSPINSNTKRSFRKLYFWLPVTYLIVIGVLTVFSLLVLNGAFLGLILGLPFILLAFAWSGFAYILFVPLLIPILNVVILYTIGYCLDKKKSGVSFGAFLTEEKNKSFKGFVYRLPTIYFLIAVLLFFIYILDFFGNIPLIILGAPLIFISLISGGISPELLIGPNVIIILVVLVVIGSMIDRKKTGNQSLHQE